LKIRYLGHSCVEIVGKHHILIDPDFTRDPEPNVEYICITHAHKDHIGRVAETPGGIVLAAADVCEIAASLGVPRNACILSNRANRLPTFKYCPATAGLTIQSTLFSMCYSVGVSPTQAARRFPSLCRMNQTYCILAMHTKRRFLPTPIFCACPGAPHHSATSATKIH